MRKYITKGSGSRITHSILGAFALITTFSLTPLLSVKAEEPQLSEPKSAQRLHKCLDKEIFKMSKKKKKKDVSQIFSKCSKPLNRWVEVLPTESREVFISQLTESIVLALEEAEKGKFVAGDEDTN